MKSLNTVSAKKCLMLLCISLFTFSACQKETTTKPQPRLESGNNSNHDFHGHLKQTKEYSSEVALKWLDMQLRLIRTGNPPGGIVPSRYFAYCGIALYESVVPGMPAYQSLAGQLTELPSLPETQPGFAYHWAAVANAALAFMNRSFFPNTSTANKQAMDSLENALNVSYQSEVNEQVLQRSVLFGKAVAAAIYEWSKTDGSANANAAYTPPVGPGLWIPTPPNFGPPNAPYWGNNRLLVAGDLNGTAPPPPIPYSTDPSSDFFKMEKEVYDVSQSLTAEQTAIALFYRDNPGYGGAHFISIFYQVMQQQQPTLDQIAFAYAKAGIGNYDAGVGCWKIKFQYNVIRPISFIRTVMGHPTWNSLITAPSHPDYPSGHSTAAGAFAETMTSILGDNYHFTDHTYDYLGMAPREYNSFYDMANEVSRARMYGGIHTMYACTQGGIQGGKISANINKLLKFLKD